MALIPLIAVEGPVKSSPDYRLGFNVSGNSQYHLIDDSSSIIVEVPHQDDRASLAFFYSATNLIVSPEPIVIPTVGIPSTGSYRMNPEVLYLPKEITQIFIYARNRGDICINFYSQK